MLLLTRSIGEKLKIGEDVTVTVLGFKGRQIRIGIDAPREIQVDRDECRASHAPGNQLDCRSAA